ncbi:MAG: hypothetical protein FWG89_04290 [Treponema sp.]|nr:hypothetical protein [Treponema sp.]
MTEINFVTIEKELDDFNEKLLNVIEKLKTVFSEANNTFAELQNSTQHDTDKLSMLERRNKLNDELNTSLGNTERMKQVIAQIQEEITKKESSYNEEFKSSLQERKQQLDAIRDWRTQAIEAANALELPREVLEEITREINNIAKTSLSEVRQEFSFFKTLGSDIKKVLDSDTFKFASKIGNDIKDGYNSLIKFQDGFNKETLARKEKADEKALELETAKLNNMRDLNLVAAGFEVENHEESLKAQLEAAKRTGDELLIYEKERALEKFNIEKDIAEAKNKEAKRIADEMADLEYDNAKKAWKNKKTGAIIDTAVAAISAAAGTVGPWWLKLLSATSALTFGSIQVATIASNPPEKFATGGIVPGSLYSGDKVHARLNSREGVFTLSDQEYLFDQIQNRKLGSGGDVQATLVVMLDSREIAKSTVELVNDGFYTIKARALR